MSSSTMEAPAIIAPGRPDPGQQRPIKISLARPDAAAEQDKEWELEVGDFVARHVLDKDAQFFDG